MEGSDAGMITVNADITIFNKAAGERRRDIYIPTKIYGVSWYASHTDSQEGTAHRGNAKYTVRIPLTARIEEGKQFINADDYYELPVDVRDGYWTIQHGCYVFKGILDLYEGEEFVNETDFERFRNEFFNVNTYADNTIRGTKYTKHWRLGGF